MVTLREAFDSVADRRVVLFGGKGGVGKTTISCVAALHYASTRRVILFTTDPASNLADLLTEQPNLAIEALDATALYDRFLAKNLDSILTVGDRGTYFDRDELRRFFELSLPGVDELMAWMRIGELAEANGDALLVVDTAPTGHTLRMLSASEHFAQLARALDSMEEKHRGIVRQLTRRNVRDAIDQFIDDFAAEAKRRRELIKAGAFVPVTLSDGIVVEQTKRLIAEVEIDVPFVILNRAAPQACDCERCRRRAQLDQEARKQFAKVIDARRSCVPLDSVQRLREYAG